MKSELKIKTQKEHTPFTMSCRFLLSRRCNVRTQNRDGNATL